MSATLADFCLRPDETNFSSPALSPAKAYSRSKREAAPSKQRRAAPVYADVVDVLATDAAGRKYGRRRCDDGAMYLGDFADDCRRARAGHARVAERRHVAARVGTTQATPSTWIVRSRRYHGEFRDGKPNDMARCAPCGREPPGPVEKGERNGGVFVDVDVFDIR